MEQHENEDVQAAAEAKSASDSGWFVGCLILLVPLLLALWVIWGAWHVINTTEITTDNDSIRLTGLLIGVGIGVVLGTTLLFQTPGGLWPRVKAFAVGGLVPALALGILFALLATPIVGIVHFPPWQSRQIVQTLIPIAHAHREYGRGTWNTRLIEGERLGWGIGIGSVDYDFMWSHRLNPGAEDDEDYIRSDGTFCAKVMVERSGKRVRILNAGLGSLPDGSIVTCPRR